MEFQRLVFVGRGSFLVSNGAMPASARLPGDLHHEAGPFLPLLLPFGQFAAAG